MEGHPLYGFLFGFSFYTASTIGSHIPSLAILLVPIIKGGKW